MDRDRVVRAVVGDDEAFSQLVAETEPDVRRTAYMILRDVEQANDAVQNALVAAWHGVRRLRDPDRFEAWLHRLTVRAALQVARAERHRCRNETAITDPCRLPRVEGGHDLVVIRDQLDRAFVRLTERERAVLVVRYHLDLSVGQAAEVLAIPPGTVKSRLHHGHRALKAAMDADERAAVEATG
jgi:RNA polymerase sigma-70 factor (ECF subfamily)